MAPGSRLLAFASLWFDPQTVTRVFEPLIADYQQQWADASESARGWIRVRGTVAFVIAVVALTPRAIILTPTPASTTRRIVARIIIFSGAASVLLSIPFLLQMRQLPLPQLIAAAVVLLPAGKMLAFPFAMPWVVEGIRRHSQPTGVERIAALRTAILAVVFAMLMIGWVIPISNQLFRNIAAPESLRPPARGARELTISELMRADAAGVVDGRYTRKGGYGAIRRELNNRAVISVLPAVLLWMHWGALRRNRKASTVLATILSVAVFFTLYFASPMVEHRLSLDVGTALWMPIIALALIGVAQRASARIRATTVCV